MKVKYDRDADILIFALREAHPINAISEPGGIIQELIDLGTLLLSVQDSGSWS